MESFGNGDLIFILDSTYSLHSLYKLSFFVFNAFVWLSFGCALSNWLQYEK